MTNLPEKRADPVELPVGQEVDRRVRALLAEQLQQSAKDNHAALELLERVDRAIWTAALRGSDSSSLARLAYEAGAEAFLKA